MILSPDTNIFINAFLGNIEKDRMESLFLIEKDLKNNRSILVSSVKNEFDKIINEYHTVIEAMLHHLNNSKNLKEAIANLPETSLLDKNKLISELKILDFDISTIEQDENQRVIFATKITDKFREIKSEFAYYKKNYFQNDNLKQDQVKNYLKTVKNDLDTVNNNYGKIVHYPDNEHWIRTAMNEPNVKTKFITYDKFKLRNSNMLQNISLEIEQIINSKLNTQFGFIFK